MWPKVPTSSPLPAKIVPASVLGNPPEIVAIRRADADRHDLDAVPPRQLSGLDRALGGVGKTIGEDHDVADPP